MVIHEANKSKMTNLLSAFWPQGRNVLHIFILVVILRVLVMVMVGITGSLLLQLL